MKKYTIPVIAIIFLIASCTKKAAPTASAPKAIDGATVFSHNCARCHGPKGIKDERTPNLQTIDLNQVSLIKSITMGKNKMPSFKDKLSKEEITAVADLIVSWHAK